LEFYHLRSFVAVAQTGNLTQAAKRLYIYPNHLKIQDSASRERVSIKALIEENGCAIVEINNAGDDPLSPCPEGAKLEN
jgi:hypothetical protein